MNIKNGLHKQISGTGLRILANYTNGLLHGFKHVSVLNDNSKVCDMLYLYGEPVFRILYSSNKIIKQEIFIW